MLRCRCPCPCWPCWLAVYLSACRWHKGNKTILNNCNIQTKNFQRFSIIADLIIYVIYNYRRYYNYIPFRWSLTIARAACACRWSLVRAAGPRRWLLIGRPALPPVGRRCWWCRQLVGRHWSPVVASVGRRWSLVVVGRPVGQPCRDTLQIRP